MISFDLTYFILKDCMQEEFRILVHETRVYRNQDGEMIFEGTASSDTLDSHRTRFNAEAQEGFQFDIMKGMEDQEPVELEAEHKGEEEPMNILGPVIVGTVSSDNKLMIRAKLDPDNPKAVYYFNKMTKPDPVTKKVKKFGLSINGVVEKAHYEYDQEAGTHIEVFDRVRLKRIGIVRKPSNPDCWVEKIIRSFNWDEANKTPTHSHDDPERLIKQMQNPENQELEANRSDTVADADTVVPGTDEANVTEESRAAEQKESLSDEVVQVDADVDADSDSDSDSDDEAKAKRNEETSDANADAAVTEEKVTRTSYWLSSSLIDAMEDVTEALCVLENLTTFDGKTLDAGMGQDCVDAGKDLLNKMLKLFGDHVNTKRSDDVADVVENGTDADANTKEKTETEDLGETRGEDSSTVTETEAKLDTRVDAEQIIRAVSDMLDNDYTERLVNRFEESQKAVMASLDEKFEALAKTNSDLSRSFDEVKAENAKLVARLAEIEKLPASRPGAQILESVTRKSVDSDKKAANLARAKAENNTAEIFNHKVFGNGYLGYGEYASV